MVHLASWGISFALTPFFSSLSLSEVTPSRKGFGCSGNYFVGFRKIPLTGMDGSSIGSKGSANFAYRCGTVSSSALPKAGALGREISSRLFLDRRSRSEPGWSSSLYGLRVNIRRMYSSPSSILLMLIPSLSKLECSSSEACPIESSSS